MKYKISNFQRAAAIDWIVYPKTYVEAYASVIVFGDEEVSKLRWQCEGVP